jgi:hypothetical protein
VRLLVLALALLLAACAGNPFASPTPPAQPLNVAEMKYRVMDELGRPWFCDPDFYPIARADERELAQQRFSEVQKDPAVFSAMVTHLKLPAAPPYTSDQQLAIYREWKTLNALELQPMSFGSPTQLGASGFAYLATRNGSSGERVDGRVSADGKVTVLSRAPSGPPPCPICLALGTRIATPHGEAEVEDLRVGDLVWTIDERGNRVAAGLVAVGSTRVPATHEVVHLTLDDGRLVTASPGHPTADGRIIGDLAADDTLDGARVVSADRGRYLVGVTYDILPAGATGAYWANGILLGSTLR